MQWFIVIGTWTGRIQDWRAYKTIAYSRDHALELVKGKPPYVEGVGVAKFVRLATVLARDYAGDQARVINL